jgi:type IV fimbrial biogenesis protein FimT
MNLPVRQPARSRGFTLIEMAVTTTIASVLAAAAVPSFSHSIGRQRLTMTTNELNATFSFARSEALARGDRVAVTPLAAGDWASGWRVFHDANDNGALDAGDRVLREFAAPSQGISIDGIGSDLNEVVSYNASGLVRRPGSDGLALGRMVIKYNNDDPRSICFSTARTRVNKGPTCS